LITDRKFTTTEKEFKMGKSNIQNKIRRLRFDADEMTQQQLADAVSASRQTIVAIEKGNYSPSLELAFRISRTFKTPLEEVFIYQSNEFQRPSKE
jgi:putative transcriptional regulator